MAISPIYLIFLYGRLAPLCLASKHTAITQCVEKRGTDKERGEMENRSNEAMYVLSLVVLMVSAGHNSFQHTRTPAQVNAHSHMHAHTDAQSHTVIWTPSLCLCVHPTLHLGQCREDIWMCGTE